MLFSDVVHAGAEKYGNRVAYRAGDASATYLELRDDVFRLANTMLDVATPGDRVAILSQNTPEFVRAYFGVPIAGMALTFLNYRLAPRELARIIDDAGATVVLVEAQYAATIESIRPSLSTVKTVVAFGDLAEAPTGSYDATLDDLTADASPAPPDLDVSEDDLAWLIYTSGTTGMPKGAMLSQRNVLTGVTAWMVQSDNRLGRDVVLMTFPLCHVAGIGVLTSVLLGTTLIIRRSFEPLDAMQAIDEYGITSTSMAPTMLGMLLDHPRIDEFDLGTLRTISYGGSSITADLLRRAMRRFPGASFVQGYGMTELAGNALYMDPTTHVEALERPELLVAAGRSMAMSRLRLVDDDMNDVPVGEVGEIVVRGDQVMLGYWNRPDANEEVFLGGWMHTGDLGRATADGYVAIVDRKKDMIVSGGENVYSREVEEVIAAIPAVREVAIVGVPDERWGEAVTAVVCLHEGATLTVAAVVEACRQELASYKKPRHVVFRDELPKNASGKILKRDLRDEIVS
jgi:acyl-CoA synthetase (AMP-forming)/AMP-acid ligase II